MSALSKLKISTRVKRKKRIRAKVSGTESKPRFTVFKSNRYLYAQLIDDTKGQTLVTASSVEEEIKGTSKKNLSSAEAIGALIAKRALEKGIQACVFDRNGYIYHGRVKVMAEKAREAGLKF